jgi:hypothetical protein
MKRISVLAVLAAAATACTPLPYRAADGSEAPKEIAAQCEYEAAKATASATDPNPLAGPMGGAYAFTENREFRKASLEAQCMRLKGYERR